MTPGETAWLSTPPPREAREAALDNRPAGAYDEKMCLICIDMARGALRPAEARRALGEMREGLGAAHAREVEEAVARAEEEAAAPSSEPPSAP